MSRTESDREDLLAEAVALVVRSEWQLPGQADVVTAGFRVTGELSFYSGQDPFYQFDAAGRLRRAYCRGALFRSQPPVLVRLVRTRTSQRTTLERTDLSPEETIAFRDEMRERLQIFADALSTGTARSLRSAPVDAPHASRLLTALAAVLHADPWLSAAIRQRR